MTQYIPPREDMIALALECVRALQADLSEESKELIRQTLRVAVEVPLAWSSEIDLDATVTGTWGENQ